jgi:hypothetical protein
VVIPPQAGQSLLTDLESNGVVIEGASSSGSPGTLAYSQFLADVAAHRVKTVDLAQFAGGTSSGTLTDGISYTVVIPPQAGRSLLLTFLHDNGVQITRASSSFTASFSMTRHIISCVGGCLTGPLPLTIACRSDGSCTATSRHWNSSKQGTINGNTLSFSGIDTSVSGCYQPSQVTLNLTVTSWSAGNAATRQPLALSGPYTVVSPATSGCSAWGLNATLTSS